LATLIVSEDPDSSVETFHFIFASLLVLLKRFRRPKNDGK